MATYLYLSITHCNEASVTRLVYFLTGFGDKVSYKSSPNNRQLLGLLIKYIFSITAVATFFNTLWEKIGLLFTSPSGHTDCIQKIFELLKAIHHSVKLFEEENGLVS